MNYFIQILLDYRFKDYTSGFIAIKKNYLNQIRLNGDYGEYFIDLIYRALLLNARIIEIPYVCVPRVSGESKTGTNFMQYLKRGIKYLKTALNLRLKLKPQSKLSTSKPIHQKSLSSFYTREAELKDLPWLGWVHCDAISKSFSVSIGPDFVSNLYFSLLEQKEPKVWVAVSEDKIIGFLSATMDLKKTIRNLKSSLTWSNTIVIFFYSISSPKKMLTLIKRLLFLNRESRICDPFPSIVTVGVTPGLNKQTIVTKLVNQASEFFLENGVNQVYIDLANDDSEGFSIFKVIGFKKLHQKNSSTLMSLSLPLDLSRSSSSVNIPENQQTL